MCHKKLIYNHNYAFFNTDSGCNLLNNKLNKIHNTIIFNNYQYKTNYSYNQLLNTYINNIKSSPYYIICNCDLPLNNIEYLSIYNESKHFNKIITHYIPIIIGHIIGTILMIFIFKKCCYNRRGYIYLHN